MNSYYTYFIGIVFLFKSLVVDVVFFWFLKYFFIHLKIHFLLLFCIFC